MIPAAVMIKLATLGLSAEHAEAVAHMLADVEKATKDEVGSAIEARRASDRERKARQRHVKSREVTGQEGTNGTKVSPKKEIPPTPPKEKTTPSNLPSESAREFDQFWSLFPNKVGKRDAEKAFVPARKRDTFEAILAGVRRYAAKTDDRPWCNPTTFLNQDRWKDQPATQAQAPPKPRNVGELSRDQLLSPRTEIDVTNYSAGRLDPGDGRRLPQGSGDAKPFAITGNEFGRI